MKCRSPTWSDDSGKHSAPSMLSESAPDARQVYATVVKIRKTRGGSLGIIFAQCQNDTGFPTILSFQSRSAAERSDKLAPGDRIRSVNGISAARMNPDEITTLLDSVIDDTVTFELEYNLPEYSSQDSACIRTKMTTMTLECVEGSLGVTLRGGISQILSSTSTLSNSNEPLVVTYVRPGGAAHRSGRIKVGDRLLKIDHRSVSNKTLLDAQQLLKQQSGESDAICGLRAHACELTLEYDVRAVEDVRRAAGPLLLEIERRAHEHLGLVFASYCRSTASASVCVQSIIPASIADRCGALHVGDQILAVNDTYVEGSLATPHEVMELLQNCNANQGYTRIQIMPYHLIANGHHLSDDSWIHRGPGPPKTLRNCSVSAITCHASPCIRSSDKVTEAECDISDQDLGHVDPASCTSRGLCHVETLTVTLMAEPGVGYGLLVATDGDRDQDTNVVISCIKEESPAYKCGCLQVNDRIISLNGEHSLTLKEVRALLELGCATPGLRLLLQTEFDVADKEIPESGLVAVRLLRNGPNLGITFAGSRISCDDFFVICDIRRGSAAHRTGALQAGDRVLAVDNRPVPVSPAGWDTVIDEAHKSHSDTVTLRIQKTTTPEHRIERMTSPLPDEIVYTVEITRRGDPLGIVVSGSEHGNGPVVVTALIPGGLATKTGALHVGDRILAINDESLEKIPLLDAVSLFRNSGDTIKIKIAVKVQNVTENKSWNNSTESLSQSSNSKKSQNMEVTNGYFNINNHKNKLLLYSDVEENFCLSPIKISAPTLCDSKCLQTSENLNEYCNQNMETPNERSNRRVEVHSVTLHKNSTSDDFGFSVSDALHEKGVYINRIRRGGPAHLSAVLRPYDRILQVNNTETTDFDCCLIVPLITSAGNKIHLVVARVFKIGHPCKKDKHMLSWASKEQLSMISKPENQYLIKRTL